MQTNATRHTTAFEQLLAIKLNDESALKALYKNNYHKIEAYILKNNGTEEQAKDIFQEAFVAVWRNIQLDKFQPENETAIDGYLYRIAKNKWMDHLRSSYYNKVVRMDDAHPDEEIDTVAPEENEYLILVRKHFQHLGENCKKILTRFYFHNQSLRKIGAAMGWSEATARNNKYRCINKLKELISQNEPS